MQRDPARPVRRTDVAESGFPKWTTRRKCGPAATEVSTTKVAHAKRLRQTQTGQIIAITHDNHWYRVIKALIESTRSSAVALTNNESRKPHSRKRSREVARFACHCRPQIAVNYYTFAQVPLLYSDNTNGTLYVSKLPIFKFVLLFCDGELVVHARGHEIWLSSSVLLACAHLGIKTAQPKIGE